MNELMGICRSLVNSENAIKRLNRSVSAIARCCRRTNAAVLCVTIAGIGLTAVLAIQDKEIKALRKQVADLTAKNAEDDSDNTSDATEEQNDQEGA